MHTLIYALVPSTDEFPESPEEMALATATHAFDKLVGIGDYSSQVFDYYTTFDDNTSRCSGPTRYGDLPMAVGLDSDEGQRMLQEAWESTVSDFKNNLQRIREFLDELDDDEIMNNVASSRRAIEHTARRSGPGVSLYDEHGRGITTQADLDYILENEDDLWIVPADVHY